MIALIHGRPPDASFDLPTAGEATMTRLYAGQLARLLGPDLPAAELAGREQRRLRTQAVLATLRALTALGAGLIADELLREAGRRRLATSPVRPPTAVVLRAQFGAVRAACEDEGAICTCW